MGKKKRIFGGYESPNTKPPLQLQFNVACVTVLTL